MAPFPVALEHSVVVSVVAVHTHRALLDRFLGLQSFLLTLPVPDAPLDELLTLTFRQFLFRFQPELDAVPGRLSSGLPFLIGTSPNILVGDGRL